MWASSSPAGAIGTANARIVGPDDIWVIKRVGYDRLVLTACHPLYSAAKRIVVFARLVGTQARGGALRSGVKQSSLAA